MLRELCRKHVNCPSRAVDATCIQRPAAGFLVELLHLNEVALFMAGSMRVFVLQHVHVINDGEEDVQLIGVYSTRELAEQAVARLRSQPGFCDTPEGFSIDEYPVDQDHWTEGYVTVRSDPE